jgi:hypothetical protein
MRPFSILVAVVGSLLIVCRAAPSVAAATVPQEHRSSGHLALAGLGELDGRGDGPAVSLARWRQAYFEVRRSADISERLPSLDDLRVRVAQRPLVRRGRTVPVAILDFSGVALPSQSTQPSRGAVFTASALRSDTYRGDRVRFTFPAEFHFSDRGAVPARWTFDADDGFGERRVDVDGFVDVEYQTAGAKRLQLRAFTAGGVVRTATFRFDVVALASPAPSDTLQLTASIPYQGSAATGDAFLYYAEGHTSLVQPVVLIEGFDLDNSLNWDEIYTLLNAQNLLEDLRAQGYDLVVLNFDDATTEIQRNSMLVVELLQQVQQAIDPRRQFTLAGASMGGVCSRYALAYMEQNQLPHRVSTWISFDAPHGGANIPLGLQYWLEFFQDESADAAFLLSRLDRPAARQLLVYHHLAPGVGADALRASLLSDLAALGDYPTQPRRVAIANGSGAGQGQGFAPGEQILRWHFDNFVTQITGDVWAVGDGPLTRIFDGAISVFYVPLDQSEVSVGPTRPFDNAPGGSRASMAQADSTAAPYGDIVALHPSHCFIPTISALALETTDLFYDVAGDPDLLSKSPFDALYYPLVNEEHVAVTPQNAQWIKDEIFSSPTAAPEASRPASMAVLYPSVPNPFNPRTTLSFDLARSSRVRLRVYDAAGRLVRVLADRPYAAGRHRVVWDGRDIKGRPAASGVYFPRLDAGGESQAVKVLLVK